MVIRFIKRFLSQTFLVGFGVWAVSTGFPATGTLTPAWGWVLTIVGIAALILGAILIPRGIRGFRNENQEIGLRRKNIISLRRTLSDLEQQIDAVRVSVEAFPLSYYETNYLSKFDGYDKFKSKRSDENEARYVGLGLQFGLKENPLFNDSFKNDSTLQSLLSKVRDLEDSLPDTKIRSLIDSLVEVKKLQSTNIIAHKLNPARWDAYVSQITQRDNVESEIDAVVKKARQNINIRLVQLSNGARYE